MNTIRQNQIDEIAERLIAIREELYVIYDDEIESYNIKGLDFDTSKDNWINFNYGISDSIENIEIMIEALTP